MSGLQFVPGPNVPPANVTVNLGEKLKKAERMRILENMRLGVIDGGMGAGGGAAGAPTTQAERNAFQYARFQQELNALSQRMTACGITEAEQRRFMELPSLMAQHEPSLTAPVAYQQHPIAMYAAAGLPGGAGGRGGARTRRAKKSKKVKKTCGRV